MKKGLVFFQKIISMFVPHQKNNDIYDLCLEWPNSDNWSISISMSSLGVLASMNQTRLPVATLNHCIGFKL